MIRLISDSSTLYSIEEGKALPCDITPLCVTINGKTYREYEDIDAEAFLNLIKAGYIPSSSQPSMGELVELLKNIRRMKFLSFLWPMVYPAPTRQLRLHGCIPNILNGFMS